MLLIDNKIVEHVLTMKDCIAVQQSAFKGLLDGSSIGRPRLDMYVPCEREDGYYRWGTVEGANDGILAVRLKSDILVWPKNHEAGGSEQKYCIEPGTYCGLVLLFSTANGKPLAIMNDGHLQHMRVGGAAGIGTDLLARVESRHLGLIGSGGMARTFLEAIVAVRPIQKVTIYSRNSERRSQFANEMQERFHIEVIAVDAPHKAVKGADIVATCTDSMTPVLRPEWIEKGMHVVALTPRELSEEVLETFDVKVQQGRESLDLPDTDTFVKGISGSPGAFVAGSAAERERLPKPRASRIKTEDWATYTEVISDRAKGRQNEEQVTFYYTVGNWGLQFSSVGGHVYKLAKDKGLGLELPLEWFIQDIRN